MQITANQQISTIGAARKSAAPRQKKNTSHSVTQSQNQLIDTPCLVLSMMFPLISPQESTSEATPRLRPPSREADEKGCVVQGTPADQKLRSEIQKYLSYVDIKCKNESMKLSIFTRIPDSKAPYI